MEIPQILEELAFDIGELPREAIEAAISQRELITPHLLRILEEGLDEIDELIENDSYQGHTFAMYLLAQFREKQAFPLILRLLCLPGDAPHIITGDVLTEDMSRILASLFSDEELDTMLSIIENRQLNEYCRAVCQTALVILVGSGGLPRHAVITYFRSLFTSKLERTPSFVWSNLVSCACDLYPKELMAEIRSAYAERLIDENFISLKSVEAILSISQEEHLNSLYQDADLIEDTVTEMEKWICPQTYY